MISLCLSFTCGVTLWALQAGHRTAGTQSPDIAEADPGALSHRRRRERSRRQCTARVREGGRELKV